jgi:thiamine pyrophosphokinase
MKALLAGAAPSRGYEVLLATLAKDSDLIIAVDGGGALCLRAGVDPHLVVGDLDSLDRKTQTALEAAGAGFVTFPADKSQTDLDLAVSEARDRGADELVVCAAFSGRLDHTLAAVGTLVAAADLLPTIVEPAQSAWLLSAQHRARLEIGPAGTTWSLLAVTSDVRLSVTGVKWPLDHALLEPLSSIGVSNVVTGSRGLAVVHSGAVLAVSPFLEAFAWPA